MVMRLQSGAGNAAVSALIAERRPAGSAAVPALEPARSAGATAGPETANATGPAAPETANAAPDRSAAAGVAAAGVAAASPESASVAAAGPAAPAPEPAGAPAAPGPEPAAVPAVAAPAASAAPAPPANGPISAEGVAASVAGAVGGGALSLAAPASAPAAAAAGGLDLGSADGGGDPGAVQEGPTDEELEGLEHEMGEAEAEKSAPAPEPQEDDGAVLARAAVADAPPIAIEEAEQGGEEPMDAGAIAAEAQGEMDAVGASGGGEYSGGGGGGGGAAIEPQPEPPAPDVSNADPAAAVSAAGSLKPAQMLETLGGADQAAANHAAKEEQKLAASPPAAMTGSAGGPSADERFPGAPAKTLPNTRQAAAKTGGEPPAPPKAPPPPQRAAASVAPTPAVQGDAKGNVTQDDAARMQASIAGMPVTDPGAQIPGAGVAPKVILTGAADPGQLAEQQGHLSETVAHATAQGAQEAAEPAGEDSLAPTIGPERLEAPIPTAPPATAAPGGAGASDDMTASVVAEEQDGPALRAAAQAAAGEIGAQKQQHAATSAQHRAAAGEEIAAQETKSQADQLAEHAAAKAGVTQARGEWTGEQQAAATAAKTEAVGAVTEAQTHIQAEKTKADAEAVKHVEAGQKEAAQAKQQGEQEAAQQREKAKQESSGGGFFGWVKSKATALYDSVREGITTIFNKVRTAITTAINKARELATSVISTAVKFVADKIKAVAGRIVAIGDRLIPGFAALRQKFKTWIVNRVRQAVAALNRIVTAVKDGIRRTLQAVGKALSAAVDLLKKGMQAAINAVKSVVKAAIEKAKAAIAALGTFAALVKDIASGPGQWLSNLGAAVMDGIKNHLWKALKTAIAGWFNDKVEQVLGLGKSVWNLLTKGGIGLAQIGKMAWEALQAAIPPALIAILVEKLVSMIVPAAGAVLAIIQGLQAAWGAVQRILAAIDRFVAFLKAVKSGNAGPAFATAVAAAAVAVIEFVSQFLLRKVAGAAAKIAGKIKAIAQKIGKRLLTALKKVGKRVKGALNRGKQKLRDKFGRKNPKQRKQDDAQKQQERLDKAVQAIKPQLAALLKKGASPLYLKAKLLYWRVRYRLSELTMLPGGAFKAKVNPETILDDPKGHKVTHEELGRVLQPLFAQAEREFAQRLESDPDARARIDQARQGREQNAPNALGGTGSRFEQQRALLGSAPTPPGTDKAAFRTHPEQDVDLSVRSSDPGNVSTSMVQNIERYDQRTTKTGRVVLGIAAKLTQNAGRYGISDQHLAMLLSAKPNERLAVTQLITEQMAPHLRVGIKKDQLEAQRFLKLVNRVTFLTATLEPTRSEGVGVPMAAAHTLWDRNRMIDGRPIVAEDVMGAGGAMAPMTPVGAAAGRPEAVRLRHERIGKIFDHLLAAAKHHELVVAEGGYNLSELGSAVQLWLGEHFRPIRNDEQLAAAEVILQAELLRFLAAYHG